MGRCGGRAGDAFVNVERRIRAWSGRIDNAGCLSSGGHLQNFEPVVTAKWRVRPLRAQKGCAVVLDEDRFGDKTEFVHQVDNGFRPNFLSLTV